MPCSLLPPTGQVTQLRPPALGLLLVLSGCSWGSPLGNRMLYEARLAELTDDDGDGFSDYDGDCDDANASVFPAAEEWCNAIDDDCDGEVDNEARDATPWYLDSDGDGYGSPDVVIRTCERLSGQVADGGDCDDLLADVYPGAPEVPYDSIDQDCDGADLIDVDGDGWAAEVAGGEDCDDEDPAISPDGEESWEAGFSDRDCDGELEEQSISVGAAAWIGESASSGTGMRVASHEAGESFLVSAHNESAYYDGGGVVYIVPNGEGGSLASLPHVRTASPSISLGTGLASGVDVNSDGLPELLIGGPDANDTRGVAYLIDGTVPQYGKDIVVPASARLVINGREPTDNLGSEVAFIGDHDGDGI